jgi:EmrB/QacA subfamily drug resistance transporter
MLAPVGMAMLFGVFPPAERIKAAAILSLPMTLAPASGPVLGGLLVTTLSWRWVFYVNVPIGLAAVTFGAIFLRPAVAPRPGRFDIVGFLLSGLGLGLLMYGVSEGPVVGWRQPQVFGPIAAGVGLLAAMIAVELHISNPIVSLRLLHDRLFRTTTAILALCFGGFVGSIYAISLYYQDGRGLDALVAGLSTFPEAVGVMLGAQIASRYGYPTLGPRLNILIGLLGVTAAMALLAVMGADTSLWWSRLFLFAGGFSMAQVFMPVQAAAFATIPPASTSAASTMFNAFLQVAGAGGVALLTTVIVAFQPTHVVAGHVVAHLVAYRAAFAVGAACALVGTIGALLLHDRDAIGTVPSGRYRRRYEAGVQPRRVLPSRSTDSTHSGCC